MLHYKQWYKTMIYTSVNKIGDEPKPYVKEVTCDGWYLFGLPIYTRENI